MNFPVGKLYPGPFIYFHNNKYKISSYSCLYISFIQLISSSTKVVPATHCMEMHVATWQLSKQWVLSERDKNSLLIVLSQFYIGIHSFLEHRSVLQWWSSRQQSFNINLIFWFNTSKTPPNPANSGKCISVPLNYLLPVDVVSNSKHKLLFLCQCIAVGKSINVSWGQVNLLWFFKASHSSRMISKLWFFPTAKILHFMRLQLRNNCSISKKTQSLWTHKSHILNINTSSTMYCKGYGTATFHWSNIQGIIYVRARGGRAFKDVGAELA